jgi:hypothetical protein
MIWKKTRITTNRYESGDYRITEDVEIHGTPFRLESFADGADPEYFPSLDAAKRAAATRAELAASKDEIARLRAELDERRQADAFGHGAAAAQSPAVAKAAELVETIAAHDDGRGIPDADEPARQEAYAAERSDEDEDEDEDAGVLTGAF